MSKTIRRAARSGAPEGAERFTTRGKREAQRAANAERTGAIRGAAEPVGRKSAKRNVGGKGGVVPTTHVIEVSK